MKHSISSIKLITTSTICLSACSNIDSTSGPPDLLVGGQLERIDIAAIVNAASNISPSQTISNSNATPTDQKTLNAARHEDKPSYDKPNKNVSYSDKLTDAIAYFYARFPPMSNTPNLGPILRNDIQDQIIAAANVSCRSWKSEFSQWASHFSFGAKSVGTIASALGTAFTPVNVKSGFSAAATIANGTATNYSDIYLQQKTTEIIYQAIDSRRANIISGLTSKRYNAHGDITPLDTYTLSMAIADGLEYHAACSIESGLQQASEAMAPKTTANGAAPTGNQQNQQPGGPQASDMLKVPAPAAGPPVNSNNNACVPPSGPPGTVSPALEGVVQKQCQNSDGT